MIDIVAGLTTKLRQLRKRFDELDVSKVKPEEVKATAEAIAAVEALLVKEKEKKQKRHEDKEKALKEKPAEEPAKEESPKIIYGVEEGKKEDAEKSVEKTHGIWKDLPKEQADELEKSDRHEAKEKVEDDKVIIPKEEFVEEHEKLVKELAPMVEEHKEQGKELERVKKAKFEIDACVEPIRGTAGSYGKVMRHDDPDSLVYVMWEGGPLKEREAFGGYYPSDLRAKAEEKKEEPIVGKKAAEGVTKENLVDYIIRYEDGQLDEEETIAFFQYLVDTGMAWNLQGHYGRTAKALIDAGYIHLPEIKEAKEQDFSEVVSPEPGKTYQCVGCGKSFTSYNDLKEHDKTHKEAFELKVQETTQPDFSAKTEGGTEGKPGVGYGGDRPGVFVGPATDENISLDSSLDRTAAVDKNSLKINVFKREWEVSPVWKNAGFTNQEFAGYDVKDDKNRKILSINTSKPMNAAQLEYALGTELLKAPKKAVLAKDMAFLKKNSQVSILQVDASRKKAKFAALDGRVRGWASLDNFLIKEAKSEEVKHGDHVDEVLGHRETEKLVDCPKGSGNIKWVSLSEVNPTEQPPATPESLNLEEAAKVRNCPNHKDRPGIYKPEYNQVLCHECWKGVEDREKWLKEPGNRPYPKESSKKIANVVLNRDGKPVKEFNSSNEALMWLHNQVDYSADYAFEHEGWSIEEVSEKEADLEGYDYFCPKCKDQLETHLEVRLHDKQCDGKIVLRSPEEQKEKEASTNQKADKGLKPGSKVIVKPTAPGVKDSYPAANWIVEPTEVTLLSYSPNAGTLDVVDVKLVDGKEESIYDFNIDKVVEQSSLQASTKKKADLPTEEKLNGYIGYYKGHQFEVYAKTSYEAQQQIAKEHGIKKSYEITIVLAEKGGETVTHKPQDVLGSLNKQTWTGKCTCGHDESLHTEPGSTECSDPACCAQSHCSAPGCNCSYPTNPKISSLNKQATIVYRTDGWHVLSEEGKNLGGPYDSKEKAVQRLRQVEWFKSHKKGLKFLSKKEAEQEIITESPLSLEDHISLMRERMSTCIDRLNTPATKTAAEEKPEEGKEVKEDPKVLVEDILLAIDLLETIYKDSPKAHDKLEELENMLYSLEQTVGLPLDLPEEKVKEPEHKEFVELKPEEKKEATVEVKAAVPPMPTDPLGPDEEYILDNRIPPGKWVKQIKKV